MTGSRLSFSLHTMRSAPVAVCTQLMFKSVIRLAFMTPLTAALMTAFMLATFPASSASVVQSEISKLGAHESDVENIVVKATRPYYHDTLERILPLYSYSQSTVAKGNSINDVLVQSPVISLNGQGGQIQNVSIRGFSRWRIQTLLNGVPIFSDRRAGASAGFIPPSWITQVSVVPGAASTYLGSGAIGGAVNLQIATPNEQNLYVGMLNNGETQEYGYEGFADSSLTPNTDKRHAYSGSTDWKISYRNADNTQDANGNALFEQFEQTALFIRHQPEQSNITEAWSLFSHNSNVGKSSSDFPQDRITTYPKNTHWLGKVSAVFDNMTSNVWWHQSQLDTQTLRPEARINESSSNAFDYGSDIGGRQRVGKWRVNWQAQLQGREGVRINESETPITSLGSQVTPEAAISAQALSIHALSLRALSIQALPAQVAKTDAFNITTLDASEIGLAGVLDASRTFQKLSVAVGTRVDWQRQSGSGQNIKKLNVSGFTGAIYALSPHWQASVYVSSAFRNPSLTERFFSGVTPRGTVLGNQRLDTEQSVNIQGGISYKNNCLLATTEVFSQNIHHYIERIEISEDVLEYVNLDSATINGLSYTANWAPHKSKLSLQLSGAWIKGEDESGNVIADIPAHNHRLTAEYQVGTIRFFSNVLYRASKTHVADGERSLDSVVTLDIGASLPFNNKVNGRVSIRNFTNQLFYVSADDRAAFAQGRSIQFALRFLF
ncbi:TonB-dependent receptor [Alteromonas genovensis]|uniref:TonB-dependent receptor n=1 Tax=Alteromonas genovensis TaxID=471225 RepID=A0A6N9THQ1_9ALTE|nr:TonB-dependent receptor [Alteromonas genovensis]NDW14228.1 TonB-dependent receptor [Alteromonas genovensis]